MNNLAFRLNMRTSDSVGYAMLHLFQF